MPWYETWAENDREVAQEHALNARMRTLAHNLVTAAGLCRAFDLGEKNYNEQYWTGRNLWYPGCGREAPR